MNSGNLGSANESPIVIDDEKTSHSKKNMPQDMRNVRILQESILDIARVCVSVCVHECMR